jgi:hypothetical protein
MRSKSGFDAWAFDIPDPNPEDLAALERAERRVQLSPEEYLHFIEAMTKDLRAEGSDDEGDDAGREPFAL